MFSSKQCLMSKFDTKIEHQGKFFGLIKNHLEITKDVCQIEVSYKNILETTWKIDICREPVHIKVQSNGSLDFHKRKGSCDETKNEFCSAWSELRKVLQDHGLIFAKGERESLNTSHGKTYCSYLLLNQYLESGFLFSKYDETPDIFKELEKTESCDISEKTKSSDASIKNDKNKEEDVIKSEIEEAKEEVNQMDKKSEDSPANQARF